MHGSFLEEYLANVLVVDLVQDVRLGQGLDLHVRGRAKCQVATLLSVRVLQFVIKNADAFYQ